MTSNIASSVITPTLAGNDSILAGHKHFFGNWISQIVWIMDAIRQGNGCPFYFGIRHLV
jgi:hypothetical protein